MGLQGLPDWRGDQVLGREGSEISVICYILGDFLGYQFKFRRVHLISKLLVNFCRSQISATRGRGYSQLWTM